LRFEGTVSEKRLRVFLSAPLDDQITNRVFEVLTIRIWCYGEEEEGKGVTRAISTVKYLGSASVELGLGTWHLVERLSLPPAPRATPPHFQRSIQA